MYASTQQDAGSKGLTFGAAGTKPIEDRTSYATALEQVYQNPDGGTKNLLALVAGAPPITQPVRIGTMPNGSAAPVGLPPLSSVPTIHFGCQGNTTNGGEQRTQTIQQSPPGLLQSYEVPTPELNNHEITVLLLCPDL
jgi:hypothetical protein